MPRTTKRRYMSKEDARTMIPDSYDIIDQMEESPMDQRPVGRARALMGTPRLPRPRPDDTRSKYHKGPKF